jgi:hypothetical protein
MILTERDGGVTLLDKTPSSGTERRVPFGEVGDLVAATFDLPGLTRGPNGWELYGER